MATTVTSSVKGRLDARIPADVLNALAVTTKDELEWNIIEDGKVMLRKRSK